MIDDVNLEDAIDVGLRSPDPDDVTAALRLDTSSARGSDAAEILFGSAIQSEHRHEAVRRLIAVHVLRGALEVIEPMVAALAVYRLADKSSPDDDDRILPILGVASEWLDDPDGDRRYRSQAGTMMRDVAAHLRLSVTTSPI